MSNEPEITDLPDDAIVPAWRARREWWGGIAETTEWRWRKQFSDFPPAIWINNRKYYRVRDLRKFNSAREAA